MDVVIAVDNSEARIAAYSDIGVTLYAPERFRLADRCEGCAGVCQGRRLCPEAFPERYGFHGLHNHLRVPTFPSELFNNTI